jgi:hypothetical protein
VSEVDKAAAALGLAPVWGKTEQVIPEVYVWPENERIWRLFLALGTQWFWGMSGPSGLRYEAVAAVMRMWRVKRSEEQDVFGKIQLMEFAMLKAWKEKNG